MKKLKQLIAFLVVALCLVTTVSDTVLPVSVYAASTTETAKKISVKKLKIKLSKTTFTYNGKDQKPKVTVTYKGKKVKSENYTVKYSSGRKLPGTYKVTVTFKGDYTGKKTLKYKIELKAPTVKVSKTTVNQATLKWSKTTKATGYIIYDNNKEKIASTKKTSYTLKNLEAGSKNIFYVRSYAKIKNKTYYSKYIKITATTSPLITGASTLYIGDTYTYKATADGKVSWSVDDEEIAEITSKGKLIAYDEGTVKIKAIANNVSSSYNVIIKVPSVKINNRYLTVEEGYTSKISTNIIPSTMEVDWETDNGGIVAVSPDGTITANSPGTATIKAVGYYKDYAYEDYCVITVKEAPSTTPSTTAPTEPPTTQAPTEPPAEESAFDVLKNYILEYGIENNDGEKFIKTYRYYDDYEVMYGILYDHYSDKILFSSIHTNYDSTRIDYSVKFELTSTSISVPVEGTIVFYTYDEYVGGGEATATMNINTFSENTNLKFYWDSSSTDYIIRDGAEILNNQLHFALKIWNSLLKESCGITMKDLGFTAYSL